MHRVRKMQQLYADLLYISRESFFLLFLKKRRNNRRYSNERVENITLSKRAICESLYKLTALRSFMETVPLNRNFRRLVRRNFRGFTVPIDAMVGRAADESNYRSDQAVAGWSRSWTSSSSMTRILLARRRFGVMSLRQEGGCFRSSVTLIVHTFPPRGAEAYRRIRCTSLRPS